VREAALIGRLRRLERGEWADWLVPALAASIWSLVLVGAQTLDARRGYVFAGGALVLLSGLHARLSGFLHAPSRIQLLPTPLPAATHFVAAIPRQRQGLLASCLLGCLAVSIAAGFSEQPTLQLVALGADWLWLCLFAWLVEPFIPAASAWLGRRFPERSPWRSLQRQLGGGWTRAEAVVHLYAPALGVGLAVLLAMPGQLVFARIEGGRPLEAAFVVLALAPLLLALVLRGVSPTLYSRGLFEAVPWLTEATRTLAGAPRPLAPSRLVGWIRDPVRRLLAIQLLRITPLPVFRLLALCAWGALLLAWDRPPSLPELAVGASLVGLWLVPARAIARHRSARATMFAHLPLPLPQRSGSDRLMIVLLVCPPALLALAVWLRWALLT
jgi:hypothetical protein